MDFVQPSKPRFLIDENAEGLRVVLPARRNWFVIVFVLCWLGGWAFGEGFALNTLLHGKAGGGALFLFFWLCAWTVGGILAAYSVGWMLKGQEIVVARQFPPSLQVQREIFGIRLRSQNFDANQIGRLRVASEKWSQFDLNYQKRWIGGINNIAFDYGARTHYFGAGLDDAEARIVVDALLKRLN